MAPAPLRTLLSARHVSETSSAFATLRQQWRSPTDILTILMVIGGDIIQRALAQLAGDPPIPYLGFSIAPVAFSFGWVAYAFMAIISVIGDGRLMPDPENSMSLINIKSGYARPNCSWVLARLFRDHHRYTKPERREGTKLPSLLPCLSRRRQRYAPAKPPRHRQDQEDYERRRARSHDEVPQTGSAKDAIVDLERGKDRQNAGKHNGGGLKVHFFSLSQDHWHPEKGLKGPTRDWVWWLGVCTIIAQLGISVVPGAVDGNWAILIVVGCGTSLALATTALPQWRHEKWAARVKDERRVVCLTAGNGSEHVPVIISDHGLRLEDLAGRHEEGWPKRSTLYASFVLALLWLVHLITVEGVQDGAWYLISAGGLGMIQNIIAAGARRAPGALGLHLKYRETCHNDEKVFKTLQAAEEVEPGTGLTLIPIFFPGGLRSEEEEWVNQRKAELARLKAKETSRTPAPDGGAQYPSKPHKFCESEQMDKYDGKTLGVNDSEDGSTKKLDDSKAEEGAAVPNCLPYIPSSPPATLVEPSPPSSRGTSIQQSRN